MRIATSTNLVSFNRDGSKTEMTFLLALYAEEGFTVLEVNLCEMLNPKGTLAGPTWSEYVQALAKLRLEHHLEFNQAHAPYAADGHILDGFLIRSIEICNMLGIPILVVHPVKGGVEENLKAYLPYVRRAEQSNLMLAFENLNDEDELTDIHELVELIHRFDSPAARICYDTGHAHMRSHDLRDDILSMKGLLVATHIADNHGRQDEHLLPFYGTIDWDTVVNTLGEIAYEGDLTFECMFFNRHLPQELKRQAIRQALTVGEHLLSKAL